MTARVSAERLRTEDRREVTQFLFEHVNKKTTLIIQQTFFDRYVDLNQQSDWPSSILLRNEERQIVAISCLDVASKASDTLSVHYTFKKGIGDESVVSIFQWFVQECIPGLYKNDTKLPVFGRDGRVVGGKTIYGSNLAIFLTTSTKTKAHGLLKEKGFRVIQFDKKRHWLVWQIAMRELLSISTGQISDRICRPVHFFYAHQPLSISPLIPSDREAAIQFLGDLFGETFPGGDIPKFVNRCIDTTAFLFPLIHCSLAVRGPWRRLFGLIHIHSEKGGKLSLLILVKAGKGAIRKYLLSWALDDFFPELINRGERSVFYDLNHDPEGTAPMEEMRLEMSGAQFDQPTIAKLVKRGFTEVKSAEGRKFEIQIGQLHTRDG